MYSILQIQVRIQFSAGYCTINYSPGEEERGGGIEYLNL
jgi:hypothetical protein